MGNEHLMCIHLVFASFGLYIATSSDYIAFEGLVFCFVFCLFLIVLV